MKNTLGFGVATPEALFASGDMRVASGKSLRSKAFSAIATDRAKGTGGY